LLVGFPYYLIAQGNIIYKLILLIFFMLLLFIFKLVRVDELKNIVSMFRFRGKGNGKTISDFENIS
jgi:hypothetical protein